MPVIRMSMKELDRCVICGKYIGKGNDPAVCSKNCLYWLEVEYSYNKAVKRDVGEFDEVPVRDPETGDTLYDTF